MKNFKFLLIALLAVITVSSCMKNDDDYVDNSAEIQARIDSILKAEKPILEQFALEHFENPVYNDSLQMWYEILQPATDDSFEYTLQNFSFVPVNATVKYKGQLLDDELTVFDEQTTPTVMTIGSSQYRLIEAFTRAFWPQEITISGEKYFPGLTPDGLKKGNKIRFIAPSPLCYGQAGNGQKIPGDSPLMFTIEVTDIKSTL